MDELVLPKNEIKSYQEELEERIRSKEAELQNIKRKIDAKERGNNERKSKLNKADFKVEVGKLYNRGEKNSSQADNTISM